MSRVCEKCGETRTNDYDGHGTYRDRGDGICARCGRSIGWHAGNTCFCRLATGMPRPTKEIDEAVSAILDLRVASHRARGGPNATVRAISVPLYMRLLKVCRDVEDILEGRRLYAGATCSLGYWQATREVQLQLEVAA